MKKEKVENWEYKIKRIIFWIIFIPVLLLLFYLIGLRCLEAPIYYYACREKLSSYVGNIQVNDSGRKYTCCVYKSYMNGFNARGNVIKQPCLAILGKFNLALIPYSGSFKVTQRSVGIFNDHFSQCLPFFGYLYETAMTMPVYSVDCDMKGWGRKFKITPKGDVLEYHIFSVTKEQGDIIFSVPLKFFD